MVASRGTAPAPGALAITHQALKDLGFPRSTIINTRLDRRDPADLAELHPVIADFVQRRTSGYEGQETTLGIRPTTWNLHTGPWRSVTWYDQAQNVCWLLACSRTHDYSMFVARSRTPDLWPTSHDLLALQDRRDRRDDFLDLATEQAVQLRALAEAKPGIEHHVLLGDEIDTSLYLEELDEGASRLWVRYKVPPRGRKDLEGELAEIMDGLFFDDSVEVNWWAGRHPAHPDGLNADDVVIHWTRRTPLSS